VKSYHFSLGDSSTGPVGYCARVQAKSKREAVRKLRRMLVEKGAMELRKWLGLGTYAPDVEYFNVYFNEKAITVKSIDDSEHLELDGRYVKRG
jgi:hypothetical protein